MKRADIQRLEKTGTEIHVENVTVRGRYVYVDRYVDPVTGVTYDLMRDFDYYRETAKPADPYDVMPFGEFKKLEDRP